jgi:hypothetical protein
VAAPEQDRPPLRNGRFRGEIADPATGGVIMRVAMQVPEKLPAKPHLGLIFLFHGFQGHENNYIGLTVESLRRLQLLDQYVVISGKSKGPGWTADDDGPVLRMISWAKETYPIDPRRVFIFGSSNGAAYVGRFGSAHQELVAGVVGYCGSYRFDAALKTRPAATRTEWFFVHGGKDRPQNSRRATEELKALGYRYVFRQMDGYGHTDIWDSIGHPDSSKAEAVRQDWLLWLHALRHKAIAPSAEEQHTLAVLLERVQAARPRPTGDSSAGGEIPGESPAEPGTLSADEWKEVARIGGEPGGKVVLAGLASPLRSDRAAAAQSMVRTVYEPAAVARLMPLLRDESVRVRSAAAQGLASAANWRYPEAQASLSRLALSRAAPLDDRLAALAAMAKGSQLALLGNFEDPLLVWTPVFLLEDESPRLREAAFAVLEKSVSDTFGYRPDLPPGERTASAEKWRRWCQERCGPAPELAR